MAAPTARAMACCLRMGQLPRFRRDQAVGFGFQTLLQKQKRRFGFQAGLDWRQEGESDGAAVLAPMLGPEQAGIERQRQDRQIEMPVERRHAGLVAALDPDRYAGALREDDDGPPFGLGLQ